MKKSKKKKINFSQVIVVIAIVNITIFTIANFVTTFFGFTISDAMVTCFFSF